jgi:hypothetical protein
MSQAGGFQEDVAGCTTRGAVGSPHVGLRLGSVVGNGWRFWTRAEVEFVSGPAGTSVMVSRIGREWTKVEDISGQRRGLPQPLSESAIT